MIYLDNAATTRPCAAAVEAITQTLTRDWANPSALYRFGTEAARLLREGMPAVQAAEECGFEDYSTFVRAFKKTFGKTPREYNKQ